MSTLQTVASINFNAHHAPMGAYFTFTCGHFNTRGGLAVQSGKPANQNIYVGIKEGDRFSAAPLRCLPFYENALAGHEKAAGAADAFLVEQSNKKTETPQFNPYTEKEIQRYYGWATDRWATQDFRFSIYTPFTDIPDSAVASPTQMRFAVVPAVIAELEIDNRRGAVTKTAFFALMIPEPGVRVLDSGLDATQAGFAYRNQFGFAAHVYEIVDEGHSSGPCKPFAFMRWSPQDGLSSRHNAIHHLGNTPGIGCEVPPGKFYKIRISLAAHIAGTATTRLEGQYLYTRYFPTLQNVLDESLALFENTKTDALCLDEQLLSSKLSAHQQFLIAHSTRSYYANTELLEMGGQPFWIVNEGEYCMMNTLDLSVDQLFWELDHNPWVVKNLLDNFVRHYSYQDQVKSPQTDAAAAGGPHGGGAANQSSEKAAETSGSRAATSLNPGGISFCHDMGVNNNFTPFGHSSYELSNLPGCFSYMTQEQLCNWILMAAAYVAKTNDTAWLTHNLPIIHACLSSMTNRDHPDPNFRTGIMKCDSSRAGYGQEITTYDSLDESLGQARNNLYLAVKCWAAFLSLGWLFGRSADFNAFLTALACAIRTAETVTAQLKDRDFLPAVFEKNNPGYQSRILPAVEALVYPLYLSTCPHRSFPGPQGFDVDWPAQWLDASDPENELTSFLEALKTHCVHLLSDPRRRNHFADGGLKLSSTSNNSWMSKIAIFQHVCRHVFKIDEIGQPLDSDNPGGFSRADAAHANWQIQGASAYWAMSDQIVSGIAQGSKYYPRCITTALWLTPGA